MDELVDVAGGKIVDRDATDDWSKHGKSRLHVKRPKLLPRHSLELIYLLDISLPSLIRATGLASELKCCRMHNNPSVLAI